MLTMSRTCNASERGGWKESYRSSDSVESSEDSDNSSTNSSLNGSRPISNAHLQPPIGCITTHCVSAVIRPERKMPPIDPLQFVKIQKNELSKKAVEQIKLAEEVKITKEKIKEVEEEWQNNLMNWKSKRKLTKNNFEDEAMPRNPNRKTKTFSEILNEKAKSGARIGYNLHKYIDPDLEDEFNLTTATSTKEVDVVLNEAEKSDSSENEILPKMDKDDSNVKLTNLDRFLNTTNECNDEKISRNGLGEMVVLNTSLLEEFSVKSDCDIQKPVENNRRGDNNISAESKMISLDSLPTQSKSSSSNQNESSQKVHVPINDWKSSHSSSTSSSHHQQNVSRKHSSLDDDSQPHNSSFEIDEEEELDEELEKLRLDQEKSFKDKLHTFEILAKQEEEAARRAAEANRKRQQNRAKLAAERSRSLSNINSQPKHILTASNSVSSSSLQNKGSNLNDDSVKSNSPNPKPVYSQSIEDSYYQLYKNTPPTSVIYNFKDKPQNQSTDDSNIKPMEKSKKNQQQKVQAKPFNEPMSKNEHSSPPIIAQQQQQLNNIYENVSTLSTNHLHLHHQTATATSTATAIQDESPLSPSETISDTDAIRNASQKLLQQQQQIYQNQPLPIRQSMVAQYSNDHYSNLPILNYGYHQNRSPELLDEKIALGYQISDDVGLPPIQITKSIQSAPPDEHPVYQNQMMINPQNFHSYENSYSNTEQTMMMPREELVSSYPPDPFHPQPQTNMNQYNTSHYLYYPKPYTNTSNVMANKTAPIKQQSLPTATRIQSQNPNRYGANGYNPNHWVIQEAELRQSTQRMQQQTAANKNLNNTGYLSVSGKKKCSKCGDELGKGCAAMVVESLSLYYHINCFRCSVCNVQLGNGTVGTDVRVRNNKLHCQNCYSNDETGLKFSRV